GAGFIACGAKDQVASSVTNRVHGLGSIGHEIQDHLLNLDAVGGDCRQLRSQVERDANIAAAHLSTHENRHLVDELIYFYRGALAGNVLNQIANPGDDGAGSLRILSNIRQRLQQLLEDEASAAQHSLERLGVADNGAERLID